MVNTVSHLGIGFLIALALGYKGKRRLSLAALSALPDIDYLTYSAFTLLSGSVSHEARTQLFYLLGHREFSHSIFFVFLVTFLIWLRTKDRRFTAGAFGAIFSHILLDYTTSAKMRIFYPLITDASVLRSTYSFDPLVNILPLLPLLILAAEYMKSRGKWNGKLDKFPSLPDPKGKKFYASVLAVLLVWVVLFPAAKVFLVDYISRAEGAEISYNDTYPISSTRYLAAYSYSDTHYKLLEASYRSGTEKSFYVEKVSVKGNVPDASAYVERAEKLYRSGVPQEIDYSVYTVSEENGKVTVIMSDARSPYVKNWPYFDVVYRFVFDRESGEYEAYLSKYGRTEVKLDRNRFE
ncbi:metal-dependent hydrolase [Methanosarcina sp. KYL-1]|uniref:metal-dependent hydrolase n=1 Tax=Methanosarcina sp. KYL-1 TaxID=2602068 RepID=UPI002100DE16|nr:metal-dependent hydrolase [Methanosarcina sp. KYL-1]MCQ1537230.1 metal-dependent hydrolase [Methanosarcina sp. KYL-1]